MGLTYTGTFIHKLFFFNTVKILWELPQFEKTFFSLTYLIVRIEYIIYITHKTVLIISKASGQLQVLVVTLG